MKTEQNRKENGWITRRKWEQMKWNEKERKGLNEERLTRQTNTDEDEQ